MSGENRVNTAEHDDKGRCVRHPNIRLRKKKILGGWKILIGHCPECCLEEMRRVRDEIEGGEKKKKKKSKDRQHHHHHHRKEKAVGEGRSDKDGNNSVNSDEGRAAKSNGGGRGPSGSAPRRQAHREDGESEGTGSTAPLSGSGNSVVSEQFYRDPGHGSMSRGHVGHFDYSPGYNPSTPNAPMSFHTSQQQQDPHQRNMVLSMAFIDPQTGQRGTYTGQVNSINHKPDGMGTVYYNNGTIAEGSWSNGILMISGGSNNSSRDWNEDADGAAERAIKASSSRGRGEVSFSQPREQSQPRTSRPVHSSVPPDSVPSSNFSGNLSRLDQLGAARNPKMNTDSASVQSYNSRGSYGPNSGSASVQFGYPTGRTQEPAYSHYDASASQYHHQNQQQQLFRGNHHQHRSINRRGENEP